MIFFFIPTITFSSAWGFDSKDVQTILKRIRDRANEVQTISSEFVQEKHLSMLKDIAVSKGVFYFERPDRLRWESITPDQIGFAVMGEKGIKWRGKTENKLHFQLDSDPVIKYFTHQVFAWIQGDYLWLKEHYRINVLSPKPAIMVLDPITDQEKKILNRIKISFSFDDRFIRSVEIHETDGDLTRIRFVNPKINIPLNPDLFQ
jgi:outer membrane lipoprotein-sorting protein